MAQFSVPITPGGAAFTADEAEKIAKDLNAPYVVKAQIHAGGRGKGTFKNGFKGGVHLCKTPAEAKDLAEKMLGQVLVTHQTGEAGREVNTVLVTESVEIEKEFYFAILMERSISGPCIVASAEGGVDIEEVAASRPEAIIKMPIDPALGMRAYEARKLAKQLGFTSKQMKGACKVFQTAYQLFIESDCSMVEINPLVLTKDEQVLALDAKLNFDDNALYRHPKITEMRDTREEDPREVKASESGLNYIGLDGNIGCMVNGAGLAMATMDIIQYHGGEPANFLDVGGGADTKQVTDAFRLLMNDPSVEAILVNIFGGIMKCNIIAEGIIAAVKEAGLNVPLVVRLEGTNVDEGRKLLKESGLDLIAAEDLADAAKKAVEAARKK